MPKTRAIRAGLLIRVDWIAGLTVGVFVLVLRNWLADLYSLPVNLILVMGFANLAYAGTSFTLAMLRDGDNVPYLRAIAAANMIWAIFCIALAVAWFSHANALGIAQFLAEAAFVGGLGILEWRAGTQ